MVSQRVTRDCSLTSASKFNVEPNGGIFDVSAGNDRASPNVKTARGTQGSPTATNICEEAASNTRGPTLDREQCLMVTSTGLQRFKYKATPYSAGQHQSCYPCSAWNEAALGAGIDGSTTLKAP